MPTKRSCQALNESFGKIPNAEELIQRKTFSIEQAYNHEFLRLVIDVCNEDGFLDGSLQELKITVRCKDLSNDRQSLLISALKTLPNAKTIILQHCSVLTMESVEKLLDAHPKLEHLDLRYSPCITDAMVEIIASKARYLNELYLSYCCGLEHIKQKGIIWNSSLKIERLQILHTGNCANLETININAPKLKRLKANHNPKLTSLRLVDAKPECLNLVYCSASHKRAFDASNLKTINLSTRNLDFLQ